MDGCRRSAHLFPSTTTYEGNGCNLDEMKDKRCLHPSCGKTFKDLNAHMLTHHSERPEKCPIQSCQYHLKGFARKYDKNRHTLAHYKGTMVCHFCPGSDPAAETSFSRTDIFKRHLTDVHGVELTPPNIRKKPTNASNSKSLADYPDETGKCSICSRIFSNAQEFYEHLDDCVLRIIQQEDPSEVINARLLAEVENDEDVLLSMQRNNLPAQTQQVGSAGDSDDDEDMDEDKSADNASSSSSVKKKVASNSKSRNLAHSRGGVPLRLKGKGGRKNKTKMPGSWGYDQELLTLKKRVMCVFDGPRRLVKDNMILSTEQEVRIKLSDGKSYTTDLDIFTVARAEAFHSATDEEKGLWLSDDPTESQRHQMQEHAMRAKREMHIADGPSSAAATQKDPGARQAFADVDGLSA